MSDNKATLVITAMINKANMTELPSYLEQVQPIFVKNGAKPIGRYKKVLDIVGVDNPEIISMTEFDDAETITAMVQSEDFTALADLRSRVFSKLNMIICTS
ncbi:MAG: hypothetical protein ACI9JN_000354 [Bacteroidia bacterium]|jgi:uncharacterized protein (DUF1330 family)